MLRLNVLLIAVVALGLGGATPQWKGSHHQDLEVPALENLDPADRIDELENAVQSLMPLKDFFLAQVDQKNSSVYFELQNAQLLTTSLQQRLEATLLETAQLNVTVAALHEKVQCAHELAKAEEDKYKLQAKNCELRINLLEEHARSGAACERLEALLQDYNASHAHQALSQELVERRAEVAELKKTGVTLAQEKVELETQYRVLQEKVSHDQRVAEQTLAASQMKVSALETCCTNSSSATSLRARNDELQQQVLAISASNTAMELELGELQKKSDALILEQKGLLETCEKQSQSLQSQVTQLTESQQRLTRESSQLTTQVNQIKQAFCRGKEVKNLVKLGTGSYYFVQHIRLNWHEAQKFCRGLGLDLVSIETQQENELLVNHLQASGLESGLEGFVWTSGTDQAVEGQFYWSATGQDFGFTNWHSGQPDNAGSENCMELWNVGTIGWNDRPCNWKGRFICELNSVCA